MTITDTQLHRYARHVILDEVGEEGQEKLLAAKVLVVGAGGLGAPLLLYLAAAGVGTLGVIDDDTVELSNLQRQVIHTTERLGAPKVESAKAALAAVNPEIKVEAIGERLTAKNAAELVSRFDLVADGSDNFDTRYLLNDACYLARVPLVSAALLRFEGQLSTFRAYEGQGENKGPCYRCIFREAPPEGTVPRCEEAGIFGAVAGAVGSLQAAEVLKELLGLGQSMSGRLLLYDALDTTFRVIKVKRDPSCPLCGDAPTITDLSGHG
ncbi:MAG TPA: molybdopterin-synthase adenylyltransferase MoeB [Alphaproteobacteria bacterium]|nr:molybdopterin-synthase adenylyltransferase MoeB [Alphaproteobacteria bacterium]